MWGMRKESSPHEYYDKFMLNFNAGWNKIREAIEADERSKRGGSIADKLATAELYKQGRSFFKTANEMNIMDFPDSKRSEIRINREKMEKLDRSSQDRICEICDELDPKARRARTVSGNGSKVTTSSSAPALRTRPVPEKSSSKAKKNDENANQHKCSRGDRCGAANGGQNKTCEEFKKPIKAQNVQKIRAFGSTLDRNSQNSENKTNKTSSRLPTTSQQQHQQLLVNRLALAKGVDKTICDRLLDEVLDNTGVRLDDVAGCESAKQALEEAVVLPSLNPGLFKGLRQPVKGILLFGPPGNGKTLLAKAVASESNQMFFNISASSLTSKWVGDSEKTIRGLFQIARNAQPAIIFIDEIDSILCERSEKDAEVSRRMKTEFLVQFDGATSSTDDRILVIGATNRPYELDDAVLRRFPKRILLGLPDERARYELISKTLKKHNMMSGLYDRDIRYIASATRGYSNADLVSLCKEAAMVPIRSIDKSRLAQTDQTKLRTLKASDFDEALRVIRPSTSDKIMTKLTDFAKHFGS